MNAKPRYILACGLLLTTVAACGGGFRRSRGPVDNPAPGDTVLSTSDPYTLWEYGDKQRHCGSIQKYDALPLYLTFANDSTGLTHSHQFKSLQDAKQFVKSYCDK